eukprot:TRINITY_DN3060_c0_g1_i1.p1 TRINITY_DN3060_c0_g1~~TRINITY_DN3060_c0_g1_i1.p1  ORF type:complete len:252 (-),score=32.32 TRINITY_DN3060_c0_g1_i1:284-1039(-)
MERRTRRAEAISRAAADTASMRALMVQKWIENDGSYQRAAQQLNVQRSRVWYWVRKAFFPDTFHTEDVGGDRRSLLCEDQKQILHKLLLAFLKESPEADAKLVHAFLCFLLQGWSIGYSTVCKLLKQMGWTWRVPVHFQVLKYTPANMKRYFLYLLWIRQQDWTKLKFMDESHIVSRQLHKRRVLGLKNKRTYLKRRTLHDASASVTIMTCLDDPEEPVVMAYRRESNTQWDFLEFVIHTRQCICSWRLSL